MNRSGIRPQSDPRLSDMMQRLVNMTPPSLSVQDLKLDPMTFKLVLSENLVLVRKCLTDSWIFFILLQWLIWVEQFRMEWIGLKITILNVVVRVRKFTQVGRYLITSPNPGSFRLNFTFLWTQNVYLEELGAPTPYKKFLSKPPRPRIF